MTKRFSPCGTFSRFTHNYEHTYPWRKNKTNTPLVVIGFLVMELKSYCNQNSGMKLENKI